MALTFGYLALLLSGLLILCNIHTTHFLQRFLHQHLISIPANGSTFDFIVVGSGSSGSVVAARLAESGHHVLLVEAGGPSHWLQGIPKLGPYFLGSPYDWNYWTKPAKDMFRAYENQSLSYARGKVLGGSSMLNFMLYMRGHSKDFDEWESLGNPGWSYRHVLPLFKRSEGFVGDVKDKDLFHGTQGRLKVQNSAHLAPINDIFKEALKELGYSFGDVNGVDEDEGFLAEPQETLDHGWRMGTFRSFVEPLMGDSRYRIEVLPYSHATRLLFRDNKHVIGVEIERFGQTLRYFTSKEVIVSGGAIGSPQLLMLSGIGPKKHLDQLGIDVVADLPVGSNLQDHVLTHQYFVMPKKDLLTSPYVHLNPLNYASFFLNGNGPLSSLGCCTTGYFHSKVNNDTTRPDLQLLSMSFGFEIDLGLGIKEAYKIREEGFDHRYGRIIDEGIEQTVNLLPALLRPKSRGTVRLRSKDPKDDPIIDLNYFSHPSDLKTMVEGAKFMHSLQDTKAFKKHGIRSPSPDEVYCKDHLAFSDSYWECFVRQWSFTVWHASGTCKMGPEEDKESVVDARLRVRGVKGLRVADASVMPRLVGANTNAACVMIGEKAASVIVEEWKGKKEDSKASRKDEL